MSVLCSFHERSERRTNTEQINARNYMKSQCCNADIEVDKGGVGVFALTTGAFICSDCRKYCVRKQHKMNKMRYCEECGMIAEDLGFDEGCEKKTVKVG